jgi:hypothetical protein
MSKYNKKKRMNKYESLANRKKTMEYHLHGEGLFVYRNNTSGTLCLPKPTPKGQTRIEANAEFEGDNYYMSLVKTNMLKFIRELISPEEERKQKMLNEEKLILDQPPTVTTKGVVEQVVTTPKKKSANKKLQEQNPSETKKEVLLTEDPLAGITILG